MSRVLAAWLLAVSQAFLCAPAAADDGPPAGAPLRVPLYHVVELPLAGPTFGPRDAPARDVHLAVTLRHESGRAHRVLGYWDGDGQGNATGGVFKVRFCLTRAGRWTIAASESNRDELRGQRQGQVLVAVPSDHAGFWVADGRWYRRLDGSRPYIVGNTHYTLLSRRDDRGPISITIDDDVRANARFFSKLRFALTGDRYVDPASKPFLDDQGLPTDDGRFSFRPNPAWFSQRADRAVAAGFQADLICDLILCGPDTVASRSTLQGDPRPWLHYVAARYGAYPNVWFCLCNEWNIKQPKYTAEEIRTAGEILRQALAYPTPVSVHSNSGPWDQALNGPWHDHVIIQHKLKTLAAAADAAQLSQERGGHKPLVNDENAYQGDGDGFSRDDVIEGCLGTLLGGGYPTTGEKFGQKLGQYFWGRFDPAAHTAAPALDLLRRYLSRQVQFWKLTPTPVQGTFLKGAGREARLLALAGQEYLLGTNRAGQLELELPPGEWKITQVDLVAIREQSLAAQARGKMMIALPSSRAVLTHFRLAGAQHDQPEFPGQEWRTKPPAEAGLDAGALRAASEFIGGRGCVVRSGYLVHTWGDAARRGDVASACKPVYTHFLLYAVQSGRLGSVDEPVAAWVPQLGRLNPALGFKDRGILWRDLACQTSCYGVTERPGSAYDYSDFNMALLCDALFLQVYGSSWERVDAEVLRALLTDPLECQHEPTLLAFGDRRPGRLGISPLDFARFGLLYLRQGSWRGRQILDPKLMERALASPVPADLPRTRGQASEMIAGQRSIGGGKNQTDHFGSYSFAWWINGVDRQGKRHWPDAPLDTFAALGHGGKRGLVVFPGWELIVSWNDSEIATRDGQNEAFRCLLQACR